MERTALKDGAAAGARREVSPQVRTRCSRKRTKEEEVRRQLERSLGAIVSASVERAKSGSLVHTKWLWGVADRVSAEPEGERESLAQMLVDELAGLSGTLLD